MRIEVVPDGGWTGSRVWAHSRWFTAADLLDRLYWQLQGDPAPEPVVEVRLLPEAVESLADHGEGLWGSTLEEHVARGIARLQGMLGPEEVLAPSVQGGRSPRDRQLLSPWGERPPTGRPATLPWPGNIPPPAPVRVFAEPRPVVVLDADHRPVRVSDRGLISGDPAFLITEPSGAPSRVPGGRDAQAGATVRIEAWAGPWPIDELWWDPTRARHVARFQIVGVDSSAWLLIIEDGQWWSEARYD